MKIAPSRAFDVRDQKLSKSEILQAWLDELTAKLNEALSLPLVGNNFITEPLTLGTTNVAVIHNLKRRPTVVYPLLISAGAIVFSDTTHDDPLNAIYLKATASCTATLLIG